VVASDTDLLSEEHEDKVMCCVLFRSL